MDGLEWVTNEPREYIGGRRMTLEQWNTWRMQFVEGRPQATAHYTADELEEMGLVGLYRRAAEGGANAAKGDG